MRKMKKVKIIGIDAIPESWEVRKSKFVLNYVKRQVEEDLDVITCFRDGIVTLRKNRREDGFTFSDKEIGYQEIHVGDFVFHGMDGFAGAIGISDSHGKGSPVLIVCEVIGNCNRYICYYFRLLAINHVFEFYSNGIRERSCDIRWEKLGKIVIPLPPLSEQQRIADYLDARCARIDESAELIRQSMEKLRAYKLSLITEAVTKGLDPDVPMKDSGIPWIGEIPKYCKCISIDKVFTLILGKMVADSPKNASDSLENYICALNVHFDGIDYSNIKRMWFSEKEKYMYKVNNGDLLIVEGGAGAGGACIAKGIYDDMYIQNSIVIARQRERISSVSFLYYMIYSLVKRGYIDFICNKATIPHFTKEKIGKTKIVFPPLSEQQRIADYLDAKCARIDAVLEEKERLLDRLAEYKKSLIFECVTGKREVSA